MQHDPQGTSPKKAIPYPVQGEDLLDSTSRSGDEIETIEPALSYRDRFFLPEDEKSFRDWVASEMPVELEIGSGKGLFLTNAARTNPQHRFVGLELAGKYAVDCQAYLEKMGIENAKFFACDAVAVLDRDVLDSTLEAVHVYFPDPWWKSRHKKRRVLSERTIRNIERTLKPNGSFHFWTDVLDYYEATLELIHEITSLNGPFFVNEPPVTHDMDYRTHFERRTRKNGLPVYRARFAKLPATAPTKN
jgi:tRNA (guanine-N7-)-methyltransferase